MATVKLQKVVKTEQKIELSTGMVFKLVNEEDYYILAWVGGDYALTNIITGGRWSKTGDMEEIAKQLESKEYPFEYCGWLDRKSLQFR